MKRKGIQTKWVFMAALFIIGVSVFGIDVLATKEDHKICKGVWIDQVNVSGMTATQAKKAIEQEIKKRQAKTVTIQVEGHQVKTNLKALGYHQKENEYVEQALLVGKSGNLLKRYKERKDIEQKKLVYPLEFLLDDKKVQNFVKKKLGKYDIPAKNATLKRKNGAFVRIDAKKGRKLIVDETIEKIKNRVLVNWDGKDIKMKAIVREDIPKYGRKDVEQVKDVLGTYQTSYPMSSASRANNLAVAATLIDGTVLYPGETFSCYAVLSPFTSEHGYQTAGAYAQGKVVDSVGGGVCQVSSTLYNAVLLSELQVVERAQHSMAVSYVPLARDAAIAGTYKDLKFRNSLDIPIYIEAYTKNRTITFTIYGKETRDKKRRSIRLVSKKLETIAPPPDVITKDSHLPKGYRKITQSAHSGAKAQLYKIILENGVEKERILINTSTYAAAPNYVVVGTKEENKDTKNKSK